MREVLVPTCVQSGSPLHTAGIEQGSFVWSIEGQEIRNMGVITEILASHEPGDVIHLIVYDEYNMRRKVPVKLGPPGR